MSLKPGQLILLKLRIDGIEQKNDGPSVVITESIPGAQRQSGGLDRASAGPASPITLLLLPRMFVPSLTFRPTLGARLGQPPKRKASQEESLGRASGRRGASYSLVLAAIVKPWAVPAVRAHVAICDQSRRAPPCGYLKARCPEADSVPGCPRCGQYAPYTRGLYRKRGGVKFCGLLLAQICAAQQLCLHFRFCFCLPTCVCSHTRSHASSPISHGPSCPIPFPCRCHSVVILKAS